MFSIATDSPARLGVKLLAAVSAVTLGALIVAGVILLGSAHARPSARPLITSAFALTGCLFGSSAPLLLFPKRRWPMALAAALGLAFVAIAGFEWLALWKAGLVVGQSRYGDVYFIASAFHMIHVIAFALALAAATTSRRDSERWLLARWLWHAVVLAWIPLAVLLYRGSL